MDVATLLGIILGALIIYGGIVIEGQIVNFYDIASIVIVFGGTIAATVVNYPFSRIKEIYGIVKNAFINKTEDYCETTQTIIRLANVARKEGLLALEEVVTNIDNSFLKKGILLIVDGTDPELVRNILETELSFVEERHKEGQGILESMGAYSPAFGLVGTLIGLVNMLRNLTDPNTLGPGMAVALITTFYGIILANLLFLPLAGKLKYKSSQEILQKEIMLEGILSIQAGENPRIIEEKLIAFIPPSQRNAPKVKNINIEGEEINV
jgi:chemotaxis protein MotA